jgi:hypothetical protein
MADKKSGNNKRPDAYVEGVIPFDPAKHESWDGGRAFPVGHYTFQVVKYGPNKDGKGVAMHLKCLKGPGDTEDMKDQIFLDFFNFGDKAGNFLKGWLEKICPQCLEPANLVKTGRGIGINAAYVTGGKGGVGAVLECDLWEDAFKDPKTGQTKTNVKADRRSAVLVTPSSFAAGATAQAAEDDSGEPAWGAPAE